MIKKITLSKILLIYLIVFCILLFSFAAAYYNNKAIGTNTGWLDAVYFSAMTYITVGYGDFCPATEVGKVLVIFEGLIGIVTNSIFTGLIFYMFLRPKNKIVMPSIMCFKYKNRKKSLTFRFGNKGHELLQPKCVVEIFRFEDDRRIRVDELTNEWPYIEKVVYFSYLFKDLKVPTRKFLYQILDGKQDYQIRITFTAYDSFTNDLVYSVKNMDSTQVKYIYEFEKIYKWENQKRGKVNWKKFDSIIELDKSNIEKLKDSANFSFS